MQEELVKTTNPKQAVKPAETSISASPFPKPGPIVIPTGTGKYSFALDSFQILNTRSVHEDTIYVGASLTILQGGNPQRMFQPVAKTKYLGDRNNGLYATGLSFNNVALADDDLALFAYNITNKNTPDQSTQQAVLGYLEQTLIKLPSMALNAVLSIPLIGSALSAIEGFLVSTFFGGLAPGACDGPVAAGVHSYTGAQIKALLATGHFSNTENNPGTDSPHGCGSNSNYNVTWSIALA